MKRLIVLVVVVLLTNLGHTIVVLDKSMAEHKEEIVGALSFSKAAIPEIDIIFKDQYEVKFILVESPLSSVVARREELKLSQNERLQQELKEEQKTKQIKYHYITLPYAGHKPIFEIYFHPLVFENICLLYFVVTKETNRITKIIGRYHKITKGEMSAIEALEETKNDDKSVSLETVVKLRVFVNKPNFLKEILGLTSEKVAKEIIRGLNEVIDLEEQRIKKKYNIQEA